MSGTSITARTAASEEIEKAFKEWNLCDHFCEFLYKFLKGFAKRKKLTYKVTWTNVRARPKYVFVRSGMNQAQVQHHLEDLRHSILIIRTESGREIAFDGTTEQFGWGETSSIMDIETFWDQHVDGDGEEWYDHGQTEEKSPAEVKHGYGEYWADVFKELLEMLDSTNWNEVLLELEPEERKVFFYLKSAKRALAVAKRFQK